jgi:polyisoprenoid-binding protein YceI
MHRSLIRNKIILMLVMFTVMTSGFSFAAGVVAFGPAETKINGSIKYSVIGQYNAQFNDFKGRIEVDETTRQVQSVYLEIKTATIESDCKWCDRIVRSDQLLASTKYPTIVFKSNEIIKAASGYTVKGDLDLHGVKRQISFPFQAQMIGKTLDAKGQLQINRKDFKITWNKMLDQGGILVGNYIKVDWGIKADIKD